MARKLIQSLPEFAFVPPWQPGMLNEPVAQILNVHDQKLQDELTKSWMHAKIAELSFVGWVVRPYCFPPSHSRGNSIGH